MHDPRGSVRLVCLSSAPWSLVGLSALAGCRSSGSGESSTGGTTSTGGDGSHGGTGTFFEGAITKSHPPDATDDAIPANIVAAGHGRCCAVLGRAPSWLFVMHAWR
jgi:hypothetical protein